jgi:CheY-like chemotaxis protein
MSSIPILYVEDEETDVMLLQHVLGKVGIHNPLHIVKDGDLAKDYLAGKVPFDDRQRHPLPGLVLLDLNLPYWSGFEVLEWIRQQPELRRVPVVILSSSNRPDDIAGHTTPGPMATWSSPTRWRSSPAWSWLSVIFGCSTTSSRIRSARARQA